MLTDIGTNASIVRAGTGNLEILALRILRTTSDMGNKKAQHVNAPAILPFVLNHLVTETTLEDPLPTEWFQINYTDKSQSYIMVTKTPIANYLTEKKIQLNVALQNGDKYVLKADAYDPEKDESAGARIDVGNNKATMKLTMKAIQSVDPTKAKLTVASALKQVGLRVLRVDQMSANGIPIQKYAIDFTRTDEFHAANLHKTPPIDFGIGENHIAKVQYNGEFLKSLYLCGTCYKYDSAFASSSDTRLTCLGHGGPSVNTNSTESKKRKQADLAKAQADSLAHAAKAHSSSDPFFDDN